MFPRNPVFHVLVLDFLHILCSVLLLQESKSIGADVNWGVRFKNANDVSGSSHYLYLLCMNVKFGDCYFLVLGSAFSDKSMQGSGTSIAGMWNARTSFYS